MIKTSEDVLLFDTGGNSEILLSNMEKMEIDPASIRNVVISHIHRDHLGGLKGFLEKNNAVTVFIPNSFPDSVEEMITNQGAEFVSVDKPRQISDFVHTTGEVDGPVKEQSLIINSKKGLIIMTGCAHPMIVNIIDKAKKIFPEESVYLVLGGFHLGGASDDTLRNIVSDFKKLGVEKVAPSHCSGDRCRKLFKEEYQDDFIDCGVGKVIQIK